MKCSTSNSTAHHMQKAVILLLVQVFIVALLVADTFAQAKVAVTTTISRTREFDPVLKGKPEQEFETLEHKLSDAFASYDVKALEQLLGKNLEVMGLTTADAKPFILGMAVEAEKFAKEYKVTAVEKTGMRIRMLDDIVTVSGRIFIDYKKENGSGTSVANFMNIWSRNKEGNWQVIAMSTDGQKLIHYRTI